MHIAVLVYGRLAKTKETYFNIIQNLGTEHTFDFFASSDNSLEEDLNDFISLYQPKSYINEQIINIEDKYEYPDAQHSYIPRAVRHYVNKMRVFELLENYITTENTHYDIVVSLRIDLYFNEKVLFSDIINENTVYIPAENNYGGINDQFAYGDFSSMKIYMNIYNNLPTLITLKGIPFHPETVVCALLCYNNMNIVRFKLSYYIVR